MAQISKESEKLVVAALLPPIQNDGAKHLHAMCGIPGSGKTTYVQSQIKDGTLPDDAFILNPDIVMEMLPEYIEDKEKLGAETAFQKWEVPSRSIAYGLFHQATSQGRTIIIDMGCARQESLTMLGSLKEMGYTMSMTHIKCDPETAIERIKTRERFTPESMVHKRFLILNELIPRYKAMADTFTEIDTTI
jgi:predicted ABC-type ATPase